MPEDDDDRRGLAEAQVESDLASKSDSSSFAGPLPSSVTLLNTVISVVALAGVVIHARWPSLKIDSVSVALLVAAVLPWLGLIMTHVKVGNLVEADFRRFEQRIERKVEMRVQRTESKVERVDGAVEGTSGGFNDAARIVGVDEAVEDRDGKLPPNEFKAPPTSGAVNLETPWERLENLVQEYNKIRATMSPGFRRTSAMTEVVQKMIQLAPELPDFDWSKNLESSDRGWRLAAYGYLYTLPRVDAVGPLVDSFTRVEDKPFGQYWGLKALNQALDKIDAETAKRIEPTLDAYATRLQPGTDRHVLVSQLLSAIRTRIRPGRAQVS
jgi:hypothetical protein